MSSIKIRLMNIMKPITGIIPDIASPDKAVPFCECRSQ